MQMISENIFSLCAIDLLDFLLRNIDYLNVAKQRERHRFNEIGIHNSMRILFAQNGVQISVKQA